MAAVSLRPTTHLMIQWFHYSMWLSATGMILIRPLHNKHLQGYEEAHWRTNTWKVWCFGWRCDDPREMEHVLMFYMTSSAWGALAWTPRWLNTTGKPDINMETHQESFYTVLTVCANTHTGICTVLYTCRKGSIHTFSKQRGKTWIHRFRWLCLETVHLCICFLFNRDIAGIQSILIYFLE